MTPSLSPIVKPLVAWYASCRKPLPWRIDASPYHVWISEIMLQQTRIEAVIPYYHRFLEAFPDVPSLAAADDEKLMKQWEGLGYYSRARNLKKAAEIMMQTFGGMLPQDASALRSLPGIGDYTAGAIASIAYGKPEPAVDGNVMRVIARVTASSEDIMLPKTRKSVSDGLRAVYPEGREAGLLTEGIMELGETICIPGGVPRCETCPLQDICEAHRTGREEELPVRSAKKDRRIEEKTILLLRAGDRYAIRCRKEAGLLSGMWEFPSLPGLCGEEEAAKEAEKLGFAPRAVRPSGKASHIFTHIEWHMTGYEIECTEVSPSDGIVLADAETIRSQFAFPTAFRAYLRKLR